jgi:hypothetical protein
MPKREVVCASDDLDVIAICFLDGHVRAFAHFGAVPHRLVYDNLRVAVRNTPAETLFIAPEVFVGPFKSPINNGTRLAVGVSFNVTGDPVNAQTYTLTASFDIPNKYGY